MSGSAEPRTSPARPPRGLPLWLWMLLLTGAIAALLYFVGRNSFAA